MGFAGLLLVGGGAVALQNTLFNVDGGHRAIKYRRLSGVSKEIYSEGMSDRSGRPTSRSTRY
jgi:prohibitin 2